LFAWAKESIGRSTEVDSGSNGAGYMHVNEKSVVNIGYYLPGENMPTADIQLLSELQGSRQTHSHWQ
jgi:hypothetical protein